MKIFLILSLYLLSFSILFSMENKSIENKNETSFIKKADPKDFFWTRKLPPPPAFFSSYENSKLGQVNWSISHIISFPLIITTVLPGGVLYYSLRDNKQYFFFSDFGHSYRVCFYFLPGIQDVSTRYIIHPIYITLSFPSISIKYLLSLVFIDI